MNGLFYRLLVRTADILGAWLLGAASRVIAAGYFLCSSRVGESRRFYSALYPGRGGLHALWCTFRQYQSFTTIHRDRYLESRAQPAAYTSSGWEGLEAAIGGQGGILLMSHLGNWEMAATLLKRQRPDLRLLLYMGVKEQDGVERLQKDGLRRSGVRIIAVGQGDNSPLAAVDGIRFLRAGGLVSMAGDIVWRRDQRKVRVTFLGRDAYLPEAPFAFALVAGAPLFAFFAFRTGPNRYHFTLSAPIALQAASRRQRGEAIARAAQQYADLLAESLRQHPFEWYHFDRFIHELSPFSQPPGTAAHESTP